MTDDMDEPSVMRSTVQYAADAPAPVGQRNGTDRLATRPPRRNHTRSSLIAAAVVLTVGAVIVVPRLSHSADAGPSSRHVSTSLPAITGGGASVHTLTTYRWRALPTAPIIGRYDEASAWTGRQLIVWGGSSGNDVLGDGASYDPASRVWTKLPPAPLTPRIGPSGTWVGGAFIVWGGYIDDQSKQRSDGARYDPVRRRWATLPPAPVTLPSRQDLVTAGDRAVLISTSRRTTRTVDASSYDPAGNRWTTLPTLTVPKNHDVDQLITRAVGSTVFVWVEWAHTGAVNSRRGETETSYGVDAYRLDAGARSWIAAPVQPDPGMAADNPLWTGQRILLPQGGRYCGGCSGPPVFNPTAVMISPTTGARITLPTGPVSTGTDEFVWTGAALLGVNPSTSGGGMHPGDTAALDPATKRWTRLARTPSRAGLTEEHILIWTGSRLISWGINTGNNPRHVGSGAEFAPPA